MFVSSPAARHTSVKRTNPTVILKEPITAYLQGICNISLLTNKQFVNSGSCIVNLEQWTGFEGAVFLLLKLSPWHEPEKESTVLPKPAKSMKIKREGDNFPGSKTKPWRHPAKRKKQAVLLPLWTSTGLHGIPSLRSLLLNFVPIYYGS
jgi:hypothetical protein